MAQEFVLKDKYNIDDLIAIIKVLRAPAVALGTESKLTNL